MHRSFFTDGPAEDSRYVSARDHNNNIREPLGRDIVFIHNPRADVGVPRGLFKFGTEYVAEEGQLAAIVDPGGDGGSGKGDPG